MVKPKELLLEVFVFEGTFKQQLKLSSALLREVCGFSFKFSDECSFIYCKSFYCISPLKQVTSICQDVHAKRKHDK